MSILIVLNKEHDFTVYLYKVVPTFFFFGGGGGGAGGGRGGRANLGILLLCIYSFYVFVLYISSFKFLFHLSLDVMTV